MKMKPTRVLVTGAAGFIGAKVTKELSNRGFSVVGVDSFSDYYDPSYKTYRLQHHQINGLVRNLDISSTNDVNKLFEESRPEVVINLAAQGGVRASKIDPRPYIVTNQLGFLNLIEAAESFNCKRFIYASSSSVFGDGLEPPFKENDHLPSPKSLYALSKISNELISQHFPSQGMQRVGLRFFTVYGPLGRPDMAVFRLLASSLLGRPFELTADLSVSRDFTYIDDVSNVISELVISSSSELPSILNVCGSRPYSLENLLNILKDLGIEISLKTKEKDSLDAKITHGSTLGLESAKLTVPTTDLREGVLAVWKWMKVLDPEVIEKWYDYRK